MQYVTFAPYYKTAKISQIMNRKVNKIGMVETCITRIPTETGETIEEMVRRCTETNEPIDTTAPMIYTEEKDGVLPQYDIRTDRFDLAIEAIDKVDKARIASAQAAPEAATNENNGGGSNEPNE